MKRNKTINQTKGKKRGRQSIKNENFMPRSLSKAFKIWHFINKLFIMQKSNKKIFFVSPLWGKEILFLSTFLSWEENDYDNVQCKVSSMEISFMTFRLLYSFSFLLWNQARTECKMISICRKVGSCKYWVV